MARKMETLGLNDPAREEEQKKVFEAQKEYLKSTEPEPDAQAGRSDGERAELTAEQKAELGKEQVGLVVDTLGQDRSISVYQRNLIQNKDFNPALKQEAQNKPTFGKKLRDRAVDFALGAGAGIVVRRATNYFAPGLGIASGAAAGGISGWIRASRAEGRRVKENKQYLESVKDKDSLEKAQEFLRLKLLYENKKTSGEQKTKIRQELEVLAPIIQKIESQEIKGLDKFKKLGGARDAASMEAVGSDAENIKILAELTRQFSTEKDKKKIRAGILRGAVYGGAGAYVGGLVMSFFEHGGDHVAHVGEHLGTKARDYWAGLKTSAAEHIDDTRPMNGSVWNTVKDFFHEHGVVNPSNQMLNEATRRITDINHVDISADHTSFMGHAEPGHFQGHHFEDLDSKVDTAMAQNTEIHGFERLSDMVPGARELAHHTINVAEPGAHLEVLMQEQHPSLEDFEKILTALGIAAVGDAAIGLYERYAKNQQVKMAKKKAVEPLAKQMAVHRAEQGIPKIGVPAAERIATAPAVESKPKESQAEKESAEWEKKTAAVETGLVALIIARRKEFTGTPEERVKNAELSEEVFGKWNEHKASLSDENRKSVFVHEQTKILVDAIFGEYKTTENSPEKSPEKSIEQWNKEIEAKAKTIAERMKAETYAAFDKGDFDSYNKVIRPRTWKEWNGYIYDRPEEIKPDTHEAVLKSEKILHEAEARIEQKWRTYPTPEMAGKAPEATTEPKLEQNLGDEVKKWQQRIEAVFDDIAKSQVQLAQKLRSSTSLEEKHKAYQEQEEYMIANLESLYEIPAAIRPKLEAHAFERSAKLEQEETRLSEYLKSLSKKPEISASVPPKQKQGLKIEAELLGVNKDVWRGVVELLQKNFNTTEADQKSYKISQFYTTGSGKSLRRALKEIYTELPTNTAWTIVGQLKRLDPALKGRFENIQNQVLSEIEKKNKNNRIHEL